MRSGAGFAGWVLPLLLMPFAGLAQDSDTAIFHDKRQGLTILSEISDSRERSAFTSAYEAKDPVSRHTQAVAFLKAYPQSWLLAEIYDLAARSSIDLGEYDRALDEGRLSLRLMPENATLLVLMANVEARRGLGDEAAAHATDALEYLDQFARPGSMTDDQWKSVRERLKASAYFARGRSYAARGMAPGSREELLKQALDDLNQAAAWNQEDVEVFYLRALVELRLGTMPAAQTDLRFVAQSQGQLGQKAAGELDRLHRAGILNLSESRAAKPAINANLRDAPSGTVTNAIRAGYAGSLSCGGCHPREYAAWRRTGMARMFREYSAENASGDFSPSAQFDPQIDRTNIRLGQNGRPYFEVRDSHGNWRKFSVDYTIGSKWQQGYATKEPDGSIYVLPIQYNFQLKSWINYWKIIDPPDSERVVISDFPKLSTATNYQENCAVCHTSQLRAKPELTEPLMHAQFREPGVNCEMCHGPSAWHVSHMRKQSLGDKPLLEPPVDFRRIGNREGVRVCAQCHRQSSIRGLGTNQEMNYRSEDASFVPDYRSRPYDAFSRRAFYKDGRFRETTFIVEAFTRSACYRKGTAQCATCHSPHLGDFSENPTSLKFKENPDEMCLPCHPQYRKNAALHTHHPLGAEASRCVSCHMPKIANALLFQARSHQIEIPRADLTARFGQDNSPNACLICHSQKDPDWAWRQLEQWRN